jgi:hypothetical protein
MHRQTHLSRLVLVCWVGLSGSYLVLKTLYEEESVFWWMPWLCLMLTTAVLLSVRPFGAPSEWLFIEGEGRSHGERG